jgi:hypothetical protein
MDIILKCFAAKIEHNMNVAEIALHFRNTLLELKNSTEWPYDNEHTLYLLDEPEDDNPYSVSVDGSGADAILTKEIYNLLTQDKAEEGLKNIQQCVDSRNLLQQRADTQNLALSNYGDGKKYLKTIVGICGTPVLVDVYRVINGFAVLDSGLQHLIKKALNVGARGHKDTLRDYQDIHESASKALTEFKQRKHLGL